MQTTMAPSKALPASGGRPAQLSSRFFAGARLPFRLVPPSSCGLPGAHQRRQRLRQGRGAAAPAAAALLPPAVVFDAATALVLPFYVAMIAAPRKPLTQRLLGSGPVFLAGAVLYGLLLATWNPLPQLAAAVQGAAAGVGGAGVAASLRAALPSMPAFAALFSTPEITVVAWVHLVLLDLLQARWGSPAAAWWTRILPRRLPADHASGCAVRGRLRGSSSLLPPPSSSPEFVFLPGSVCTPLHTHTLTHHTPTMPADGCTGTACAATSPSGTPVRGQLRCHRGQLWPPRWPTPEHAGIACLLQTCVFRSCFRPTNQRLCCPPPAPPCSRAVLHGGPAGPAVPPGHQGGGATGAGARPGPGVRGVPLLMGHPYRSRAAVPP